MLNNLRRWLVPLLVGLAVLLVSAAGAYLLTRDVGQLPGALSAGMKAPAAREFLLATILRLFLPFYLGLGLVTWLLTVGVGTAFVRGWSKTWTVKDALWLMPTAFLAMHVVLWFQVPSTLGVFPLIQRLPFWVSLPLLTLVALVSAGRWVWTKAQGWRRPALFVAFLAAWSLPALLPQWLPRIQAAPRSGDEQCKVLMLGFDGLRPDVGGVATQDWGGTLFPHTYTPVPATRLLWHSLLGGDPLYYTVGHVTPSLEEFQGGGKHLELLEDAKAKGWRPRFYIDDGGTIGFVGRAHGFDDIAMPAAGWENFLCSNFTASFPLVAVWENWARAFPTTNPWVPFDAGLKESLRLGRGSRWVMFHSCLAHQPVYLRWAELQRIPRWWTLNPRKMRPLLSIHQVNQQTVETWDPRCNPFLAYRLRCESVLDAWKPLWNGLASDPNYKDAVRFLFSDHGERFYHVTNDIQLMGVHGYTLNPWECRSMMRVAGPGIPEGSRPETISLMAMTDQIRQMVDRRNDFDLNQFAQVYPLAPMRYHNLSTKGLTLEEAEYAEMDTKDLITGTFLLPNGLWVTQYKKSAEERAATVSVAVGDRDRMTAWRPLKAGGAHQFIYQGFLLKEWNEVSQEDYLKAKAEVEALFKPKGATR